MQRIAPKNHPASLRGMVMLSRRLASPAQRLNESAPNDHSFYRDRGTTEVGKHLRCAPLNPVRGVAWYCLGMKQEASFTIGDHHYEIRKIGKMPDGGFRA